jgi:hypothetical protein
VDEAVRQQVQRCRHKTLIDRIGGESKQFKRSRTEQRMIVIVTDDAQDGARVIADPQDSNGKVSDYCSPICHDEFGPVVRHHSKLRQQAPREQTVHCAGVHQRIDRHKRTGRCGRDLDPLSKQTHSHASDCTSATLAPSIQVPMGLSAELGAYYGV